MYKAAYKYIFTFLNEYILQCSNIIQIAIALEVLLYFFFFDFLGIFQSDIMQFARQSVLNSNKIPN